MRRCSAARRSGSAVAPAFSGAQNTPATVSPRSTNTSSTALPKSLCPTMAIRITKSPWLLPTPSYDISYIISPKLSVQSAKRVRTLAQWGQIQRLGRISFGRWRNVQLTLTHSHNPRNKGDHMAGRNFLFVPWPTNVPDRVLRAMAGAMEDHRSAVLPEL